MINKIGTNTDVGNKQAYFTLLPPNLPFATTQTRPSARSNVTNMLQLHSEILEELQQTVPFADHEQAMIKEATPKRKAFHMRWHSEDSIPVRRPPLANAHSGWSNRRSLDIQRTPLHEPTTLACTPATAADVGRIFAKNVSAAER